MPTGEGSVCYRAAAGPAFQQTQDEVVALLDADPDAPPVEVTRDEYGFTWLLDRHDAGRRTGPGHRPARGQHRPGGAGLRAGAALLAGAVRRHRRPRVGLVYLYKQGTFYPFAPQPGPGQRRRNNLLEIQVRDALAGELPVEQDLGRWLAVWGAPGL